MEEQQQMHPVKKQMASIKYNNRSFPLYNGLNTIGRTRTATVPILNPRISHQHAVVTIVDENQCYISDYGSSNGVKLNGLSLLPLRLYPLDETTTTIKLADVLDVTFTKHSSRSQCVESGASEKSDVSSYGNFSQNTLLSMDTQPIDATDDATDDSNDGRIKPSNESSMQNGTKRLTAVVEDNSVDAENHQSIRSVELCGTSKDTNSDERSLIEVAETYRASPVAQISYHEMETQRIHRNAAQESSLQTEELGFNELPTQLIDYSTKTNETIDEPEKTQDTKLDDTNTPTTGRSNEKLGYESSVKLNDSSNDSLDDFDESAAVETNTSENNKSAKEFVEDSFEATSDSNDSINLLEREDVQATKANKRRILYSDSDSDGRESPILKKKNSIVRPIVACSPDSSSVDKRNKNDSDSETDMEDEDLDGRSKSPLAEQQNNPTNTTDIDEEDAVIPATPEERNECDDKNYRDAVVDDDPDIIPCTQDAFTEELEFNFVTQDLVVAAKQQNSDKFANNSEVASLRLVLSSGTIEPEEEQTTEKKRDDKDTETEDDHIFLQPTQKVFRNKPKKYTEEYLAEVFDAPTQKLNAISTDADDADGILEMATQKLNVTSAAADKGDAMFEMATQKLDEMSIVADEGGEMFELATQRLTVVNDELETDDLFNAATQKITYADDDNPVSPVNIFEMATQRITLPEEDVPSTNPVNLYEMATQKLVDDDVNIYNMATQKLPAVTPIAKDDIESQLEVIFGEHTPIKVPSNDSRPSNPVANMFDLENTQTQTPLSKSPNNCYSQADTLTMEDTVEDNAVKEQERDNKRLAKRDLSADIRNDASSKSTDIDEAEPSTSKKNRIALDDNKEVVVTDDTNLFEESATNAFKINTNKNAPEAHTDDESVAADSIAVSEDEMLINGSNDATAPLPINLNSSFIRNTRRSKVDAKSDVVCESSSIRSSSRLKTPSKDAISTSRKETKRNRSIKSTKSECSSDATVDTTESPARRISGYKENSSQSSQELRVLLINCASSTPGFRSSRKSLESADGSTEDDSSNRLVEEKTTMAVSEISDTSVYKVSTRGNCLKRKISPRNDSSFQESVSSTLKTVPNKTQLRSSGAHESENLIKETAKQEKVTCLSVEEELPKRRRLRNNSNVTVGKETEETAKPEESKVVSNKRQLRKTHTAVTEIVREENTVDDKEKRNTRTTKNTTDLDISVEAPDRRNLRNKVKDVTPTPEKSTITTKKSIPSTRRGVNRNFASSKDGQVAMEKLSLVKEAVVVIKTSPILESSSTVASTGDDTNSDDEFKTSTPKVGPKKKPAQKKLTQSSTDLDNSMLESSQRSKRTLKPKVVFTMYDNPDYESVVRRLGGQMVDDVHKCTVLVTEGVKRTQKLLCAIGEGKPIVTPQWLKECKVANKFLDPWKYIIEDREAEKKWNFSLREAIRSANKRKLFDGIVVQLLVTNHIPVLKDAIESGGGKCLMKAPPKNSAGDFIIVSTSEDRAKYSRLLKKKDGPLITATEAIFLGVLQQKLLFKEHILS